MNIRLISSHCAICSVVTAVMINVWLSVFQQTTMTCTSGRLTTTQSSGGRCGTSVAWSAPNSMKRWVHCCGGGHLSKAYSVLSFCCSQKVIDTERPLTSVVVWLGNRRLYCHVETVNLFLPGAIQLLWMVASWREEGTEELLQMKIKPLKTFRVARQRFI